MIAAAHRPALSTGNRARLIALAAGGLSALLLAALLNRIGSGRDFLPSGHSIWLTVHLLTVIPAVPLGGYVLVRRKGDRLHRMLGRTWAVMMMVAALSSFGLHSVTGGFSPIHLLSILTLVTIPRGVIQAMRGDIRRHRRSMGLTYAGLCIASVFTMVPGRLIGSWLFG